MNAQEETLQAQMFMRRIVEASKVLDNSYVLEKLADIIKWDDDAACTAAELALSPTNDEFVGAMAKYIERARLHAAFGQDWKAKSNYGDFEDLEIYAGEWE